MKKYKIEAYIEPKEEEFWVLEHKDRFTVESVFGAVVEFHETDKKTKVEDFDEEIDEIIREWLLEDIEIFINLPEEEED